MWRKIYFRIQVAMSLDRQANLAVKEVTSLSGPSLSGAGNFPSRLTNLKNKPNGSDNTFFTSILHPFLTLARKFPKSILPLILLSGSCTFNDEQAPEGNSDVEKAGYISVPEVVAAGRPKTIQVNPNTLRVIPAKSKTLPQVQKQVQPAVNNTHRALPPERIPIEGEHSDPEKNVGPSARKIAAKGLQLNIQNPELVTALPPDFRDDAQFNIQVLEVQQGLTSSSCLSIVEDRRGHLWLGAPNGGLTRYDGRYFAHYTTRQGLSSDQVTSLLEDQHGNLWIGTGNYGGILRYDGQSFTRFGVEQGIPSRVIWDILEDRQGDLWFATENEGVIHYDGKNFTFFTTEEGLSSNTVFSMAEDRNGRLWFGTVGGGVTVFDGQNYTSYAQAGDTANVVTAIVEDQRGDIWLGTARNGVFQYDGSDFWHYSTEQGLSHNAILDILEDDQSNLWFATRGGGASRYDGRHFSHFGVNEGMSSNAILTLGKDHWGNIWFGTEGGGVCMFTPNSFQHITQKQGLRSNPVRTIMETRDGSLWLGTQRGDIIRYDGDQFVNFSLEEIGTNYIVSNLEDKSGQLWFGTFGNGVIRYDPVSGKFIQFSESEGLSNNNVERILQDQHGNFWFGTFEGGVNKFAPDASNDQGSFTWFSEEDGLPGNSVISLFEDSGGDLWFGTLRNGVARFDGENFATYTTEQGLSHNGVRVIFEDSRGYIWFGTEGGGLDRFDGKSFVRYQLKEGLGDNYIQSIQEDQHGNFWFATMDGLYYATLSEPSGSEDHPPPTEGSPVLKIVEYSRADGLKSEDFLANSSCLDRTNRLWLGTEKGLTVLDLAQHRLASEPPLVYLRQLELNQKVIDISNAEALQSLALPIDDMEPFSNLPVGLELPYALNSPTFRYAALDGPHSYKVSFQYRLSGSDLNWSPPTKETYVEYRNLPAGKYTFELRAINESGIWSEPILYAFSVKPPWWGSWWAYTLLALLAGGMIYALYRFQLSRQLEKKETENLRALDVFKNRLYTNITHEIRTPLTVISGMADQIKGQEKIKRLIKSNSADLINLVNQILDLRKLEMGKLQLKYIQADVVLFLRNIVESYQALAGQKGIDLHFIPKTQELWMDFDQQKLLHILSNLLSNAIKFTPQGGNVFLEMEKSSEMEDTAKERKTLKISVIDTGIGISHENQPFIFERFYQVDQHSKSTRTDQNTAIENQYRGPGGGSGVGLALTKDLVALMNGQIRLESIPGKGTTFTVLLPISQKAQTVDIDKSSEAVIETAHFISPTGPVSEPVQQSETAVSGDEKARLLIIEDNPDVVEYLNALLDEQYKLLLARDGEEGIAAAFDHIPDLILSDVMMPGMDGLEVCSILKQDERTSHIPIVLLTAKADIESRIEGLERGADAYLAKPFNQKELFVRLQKLNELRQHLRQRYQSLDVQLKTESLPEDHIFQQQDAFVAKLREEVEQNMEDPNFGTTELCRKVGMSRSHLHLKITALTGRSTSNFIRTLRLQKAKELLENTQMNVSEVTFEVGMNDRSYFSRKFKEEFGLSPSALIAKRPLI